MTNVPDKLTDAQKIIQGMVILSQYDPDMGIYAEHDIIYCGSSDLPLSPDEDYAMRWTLGWHTEMDSWAIFT